ncbi:hypothetical protein ABXM81_13420, partial [Enterococcus faecium]
MTKKIVVALGGNAILTNDPTATGQQKTLVETAQSLWNGNSFFDKFYKVQNFFPYAIPIVLD